jgi:hypothetical protein
MSPVTGKSPLKIEKSLFDAFALQNEVQFKRSESA